MSDFFSSQVEIYNQNPIIYDVIDDDMKKYEQLDISSSGIGVKDSNDNNLEPEIYLYDNEGVKQKTGINMNINDTTGKHEVNFIIKGLNKMTINDDGVSGSLPSELPPQSGNANKILTTNGTTTTWTDAPTLTVVNSSTGINGGIKFGSNTGVDGTTTGVNLRVGGTTVVGVSSSTVTSTGVINITHSGSQNNPSLSFGDRVAGSLSGLYSSPTDDNINICTGSVERLRISNTTTTVTNNLNVSGNIVCSGSISGSLPSSNKATIIAANSSTEYAYNSSNTSPATILITTNSTVKKNITIGNLGVNYDGFNFEFLFSGASTQIIGNFIDFKCELVNTVLIHRLGVEITTSVNQQSSSFNIYNNSVNNARFMGCFVWNSGTPYWIIRDVSDYQQRFSNLVIKDPTSSYTITRNTPQILSLDRTSNRTIVFTNLNNDSGFNTNNYGFQVLIQCYALPTTGSLTFSNTSGSDLEVLNSNVDRGTISNGGTLVLVAANGVSKTFKCIFKENAIGGYQWFVYQNQ